MHSLRNFLSLGLAEVVGGLGIEKLNSLMPDIVSSAEKADIQPHVRDGYLMMYIYLPSGEQLAMPYEDDNYHKLAMLWFWGAPMIMKEEIDLIIL